MIRREPLLPHGPSSPDHAPRRVGAAVALALVLPALLATAAGAQTTTYVAYGDSITAGTGDSQPEGESAGYPYRLEDLLTGATVLNRGQEGGTSSDLLQDFSNQVLGSGADVLLLMVGTNDVGKADEVGLEQALSNIGQMARLAGNFGIDTIHATVIPRWPAARQDADNLFTRQLNQELRNLAGINGRSLVDVNERFFREPRHFALWYADRPGDPVGHPNPAGYDVIAETFADVIEGRDTMSPVPGLISPLNGEKRVGRNERILLDLWDFGTGIATGSVELVVDGQTVQPQTISDGRRLAIIYSPPGPMLGRVTVAVRADDLASPANRIQREVATFFTVQTDFPAGDVNRDGRVDGRDLVVVARGFGRDSSQSLYDPDADFDGDGDIDGADLAVLVENFGVSL